MTVGWLWLLATKIRSRTPREAADSRSRKPHAAQNSRSARQEILYADVNAQSGSVMAFRDIDVLDTHGLVLG